MIYVKSVVVGIVTSLAALALFSVLTSAIYSTGFIMHAIYRSGGGMLVVLSDLPIAVMPIGSIVGVFWSFRFQTERTRRAPKNIR